MPKCHALCKRDEHNARHFATRLNEALCGTMNASSSLAAALLLGLPSVGAAVEYVCPVEKKWNLERTYSEEELARFRFTVRIEETAAGAFLSRCSYSMIENRDTCDRYAVDRIAFDERVSLKKYYVFSSQFDVQLFRDLRMIENNGRGDFATGKCTVVSP